MLTTSVQPVDDRLKQKRLDFERVDDSRRRGRADGRRRRDAAHFVLIVRREPYVRAAQRALLRRLLEHETATMDDIRDVVILPDDIDPTLFGPAVRALSVGRLIVKVGSEQTSRPVAHARDVKIWRLVDRSAALAWLTAHPEMLPSNESGVA